MIERENSTRHACPVDLLADRAAEAIVASNAADAVCLSAPSRSPECAVAERKMLEAARALGQIGDCAALFQASTPKGIFFQLALIFAEARALWELHEVGRGQTADLARAKLTRHLYSIRAFVERATGEAMPPILSAYYMDEGPGGLVHPLLLKPQPTLADQASD